MTKVENDPEVMNTEYQKFKIEIAERYGYVCGACGEPFKTHEDIRLDIIYPDGIRGILCLDCQSAVNFIECCGLEQVLLILNYLEG